MIVAGQLLLPGRSGTVRIAPGFVRIDGEVIREVVEGDLPRSADLGGADFLVTPGLIDAHVHLPQFDSVGAHGRPLLEWLEQAIFPAERKWEDPAYARGMTERVVQQFFSHGTTAACAYATVHHAGTLAALEVAAAHGLKGLVGQTLINRYAPDFLCCETNQLLDETANLLERFPPGNRLAAAVTPRFAVSCTPDLLDAAGKLAGKRGAYVQSHLAETMPECELVAELFDGKSYVEVYRKAGLLTQHSVYGHGIYLDDDDRATIREAGTIIAHCPTANSFLRSGKMHRAKLLASGNRMALGSDIGAGYERSMVRVARAMVETASALSDSYPTAAESWWQITAGNALSLGWEDAGVLRTGSPADLLLVHPDVPWLSTNVDPLAMVLFAWDDRWLKRTWIRGQVAYRAD